tara:strand:+ start:1229 stop:1420 length:192 start_codon:yes stop_codon:yes gene_type:complete
MMKRIMSRFKKKVEEKIEIDVETAIDIRKRSREDKIFYSRVGFYLTGIMAFVESTFNLVGGCI